MDENKNNKNVPAAEPSVEAPAVKGAAQTPSGKNVNVPVESMAEEVREEKIFENPELYAQATSEEPMEDSETPLDKNVRLMSPTRMVVRRFFRSKLSIVGLVMLISLLVFCWVGPLFTHSWAETQIDNNGPLKATIREVRLKDSDGKDLSFWFVSEEIMATNFKAAPSSSHILGTDENAMDVFVRLMYGGRRSLTISFIAVFACLILGVIMGGIAGYFGGWVDNLIMRICDILGCLPGLPIMLIIGTLLDGLDIAPGNRIYFLMLFLTIFSWSGTARLVRGQILFLREQEYMVAAEAMGFSVARKIFKHLVPNVMPQLIVSVTLSLGSMILYEASLSYLGLGVQPPFASWGAMVNSTNDPDVLANNFNIWGPPGICIIIAVLGFNFIGDGLRDALDPKMRR